MEDLKNKLLALEDISVDEEKMGSEDIKNVFCKYWDSAVIVLEALKTVIKNPIAKFVISIVIDLGTSIKNKVCPAD